MAESIAASEWLPARGRGIERTLDACRRAGTPEPEVEYEATGLWVLE